MLLRVIGAGVMGLAAAFEMARQGRAAGVRVELVERQDGVGLGCSFFAGGMIAPWCEAAKRGADRRRTRRRGARLLDAEHSGCDGERQPRRRAARATGRSCADFARRTRHFEEARAKRDSPSWSPILLAALRKLCSFRRRRISSRAPPWPRSPRGLQTMDNVDIRLGVDAGRRDDAPTGRSTAAALPRATRLPICAASRARCWFWQPRRSRCRARCGCCIRAIRSMWCRAAMGVFMIGATMIENEERSRVTARSIVELVNSAYAIHPAFAEAEIVETGSDVRPAFPDNLPRISRRGPRRSISTGSTGTAFCSRRRSRSRVARVVLRRRIFSGGHGCRSV